jgi:hypothetical protein
MLKAVIGLRYDVAPIRIPPLAVSHGRLMTSEAVAGEQRKKPGLRHRAEATQL